MARKSQPLTPLIVCEQKSMSKAFKIAVISVLCVPFMLLGALLLTSDRGKTAGAIMLLVAAIPFAIVIWRATRLSAVSEQAPPGLGSPAAHAFVLKVVPPIFASFVVLVGIGYIMGGSNHLFDRSPVIHYGTDKDMAAIMSLSTSLPEDQYHQFDAAMLNIIQACVGATLPTRNPSAGEDCAKRNLDGKTVNQIINLGSKLADTSMSINDLLALVKN
jgi:hypothetical protein